MKGNGINFAEVLLFVGVFVGLPLASIYGVEWVAEWFIGEITSIGE